MNARTTILQTFERVLRESGRDLPELTDEATFGESLRLDSLDLAVIVVTLESQLGVDPFREATAPVRTLGEFIAVYERAVA